MIVTLNSISSLFVYLMVDTDIYIFNSSRYEFITDSCNINSLIYSIIHVHCIILVYIISI